MLLAFGLFLKNNILQKAGLVTFVVCALLAIPVYLTGEEAGNTIRNLPGISDDTINRHEELAEKAIWFIEVLGALSLMSLVIAFKDRKFRIACLVILTIAVISFVMIVLVGHTGGRIRHTELL
ncbi:MAG: hypothetical protein CVU06_01445 [Bacteroidetes bacterium HGW-Bacteroidetes-22]|nr:MAG: hypothetical protein CVU06_01445 [Bacteroidetes bacterium HGW-Bacteroidetes-22]